MIASHATLLFASYAAFFVALVAGGAFLLQEGRLKRKDPGVLVGPAVSLELLDRVNLLAVVAGFGLFSLGITQGYLLARQSWGAFLTTDPKVVFSFLTWGSYAAVLFLRLTAGLKGRRVVAISMMAFLLVLFTFVGVNYFVGGRHVFF